ncbi:MAG: hypothetical protein HQ523_04160 [Lentisphaerae bacterium]|nr:hypothetical protein [Lentisphaerota bacterium]
MTRPPRWTILLPGTLFVVLAISWSLWFPYAPQRVRAALPANAILVSEHHHLAEDAAALLQNPALRQSFSVLGGDPTELDAFMSSGTGRWLTRCLGGRYALVAYAPAAPRGGPPSWMAASWGGPRAQILRWLMAGGWIPGWSRLPGHSAVPCYRFDGDPDFPVLSAAIYEGVVLLCYSQDPSAVRDMTRRLSYGEAASDLPAVDDAAMDRAQLRWPTAEADIPRGEVGWAASASGPLELSADWPTAVALPMLRRWGHRAGFTGLVPGFNLPMLGALPAATADAADWQRLQAGLGEVSGGVVLAPAALLESSLAASGNLEWIDLYNQTLGPHVVADGLLAVGLLREAFSGRLLGIKTPSLVLALSVAPDMDAGVVLPSLLDRCNAALGSALLVQERHAEGGAPYFIIDDARSGIYSSMKVSEKPCLWREGGWLFMASNLNAAEAVRRRMAQPLSEALPQGDWWHAVQAEPASLHHWMDFAAAGTALRKLAALHAIVQIAQGHGSGPAVELMTATGHAVSALEPFGEGRARLALTPEAWHIDARVGR